jgi:glycosyltransferase involved in cell wall biosynthesis
MLSVHYPKPRQRLAMRLSMTAFYPRADKVIAVSQGAAADVARLAGLSADVVEVVYNPIDLPNEVAETAASRQLWGEQGPRIISAGALKPEKNHELLIRAFAQLLDRRPSARLLIIGEGALRPRLQALCVEVGIDDKVRMAGFQLDPWPYYAGADLFVLSSDNEGLPLVLVEAMHAGLRLVSTECAEGVGEILDGDRFGKLVPVGNEDALAAAMEQALDEPANPARQKARARELAGPRQFARYVELLTA